MGAACDKHGDLQNAGVSKQEKVADCNQRIDFESGQGKRQD